MKQTICWTLVLIAACAICSLITYQITYRRGFENGYWNGVDTSIGEGSFVRSGGALAVLQKLRAGEVLSATRILETNCFDSAHIFYEKPARIAEAAQWVNPQKLMWYPGSAEAKALAQGLSRYRATYRTNSADWDAMEQKLVVELANVK